MEEKVLTDPDVFPSDEVIFSHIGRTKKYWIDLFNFIRSEYPDFDEEWNYYKDGKSWLLKIVRKKKTVCWISVIKNNFLMTFYFTDRVEPLLAESNISDELKIQFDSAKYYNKIRGLTITFNNKKDLDYAKILLDIKLKVK